MRTGNSKNPYGTLKNVSAAGSAAFLARMVQFFKMTKAITKRMKPIVRDVVSASNNAGPVASQWSLVVSSPPGWLWSGK